VGEREQHHPTRVGARDDEVRDAVCQCVGFARARARFAISFGAWQESLTLGRGEVPVMVALRLFLPESGTSDLSRLKRAGVPPPMSHRKNDLMVWNDPALGGIVCQSSVVS
jgi:hypothetical protein